MGSERPLVPPIKAILILDDDGNRIARKIYAESLEAAAREDPSSELDTLLFRKSRSVNAIHEAEVLALPRGDTAIYRCLAKLRVDGSAALLSPLTC